jgi:hypothetical protein
MRHYDCYMTTVQPIRDHISPVPLPVPYRLVRPLNHSAPEAPIDTSTATDRHCIIVQGIQKWFLTGDTNEPDNTDPTIQPDNTDPIIQIGWLHVFTFLIRR